MVRCLKVICAILSVYIPIASAFTSLGKPQISLWGAAQGKWSRSRLNVVMAATTIERKKVERAGPAVLERPVADKNIVREPTKKRSRIGNEGWEIRIYNDGMNTREHVARCLVQVTGLSEIAAYETMMQAHRNGMAVVGRWVYERAEMYHEALKKNGIICDMVPVDDSDR